MCQIKNNRVVLNSKGGRNKLRKGRTVKADKVERSSGNVFADLGFRDAEDRMWKAQLAIKISRLIQSKGWTQAQAAEREGLDQPKVSQLMRDGLTGFSADRLFAILNRLGYNVEVRISTKEQPPEKNAHACHDRLGRAHFHLLGDCLTNALPCQILSHSLVRVRYHNLGDQHPFFLDRGDAGGDRSAHGSYFAR